MNTETLVTDKATLENITHVRQWTDKLFSFRTTRPHGYLFTPGQYARLGLSDNGAIVWRAYSLVSSASDDYLEFYSVVVPNGTFTTLLKDIEPGNTIWIEKQSYGFMTADRFSDGRELWMLATGTGLGPFISILRDPMVWRKFADLILVHCVRHDDEFAYQDQLLELSRNPPEGATAHLQIIQSVTRATAHQTGRMNGRITTLLENGALEKTSGCPITVESARIMLCGNPAMIEDTRRILHQRGLRPCRRAVPGQFVTENYW